MSSSDIPQAQVTTDEAESHDPLRKQSRTEEKRNRHNQHQAHQTKILVIGQRVTGDDAGTRGKRGKRWPPGGAGGKGGRLELEW